MTEKRVYLDFNASTPLDPESLRPCSLPHEARIRFSPGARRQ
jgi:hypothetical protein